MIKKFQQYIKEELDYNTYHRAARQLKSKGHPERAKRLEQHPTTHNSQLDAFSKYADFNESPLHIWDLNGKVLKVYFTGWETMILSEEIMDGTASIISHFIYKDYNGEWRGYPIPIVITYLQDKSEFRGFGDRRKRVKTGKPGIEFSSFDYLEEDKYPRFTNRKDALRFRNLFISDDILEEIIDDAVEEAKEFGFSNDVKPVRVRDIYAEFKKISVNDLFLGSPYTFTLTETGEDVILQRPFQPYYQDPNEDQKSTE